MTIHIKRIQIFILFTFIYTCNLFSIESITKKSQIPTGPFYLDENQNYIIDLPADVTVSKNDKNTLVCLFNQKPITIITEITDLQKTEYKDSQKYTKYKLEKLSAKYNISDEKIDDYTYTFSEFDFTLDNSILSGISLCIQIPQNNEILFILCYSPKENYQKEGMIYILSSLNSLCLNINDYCKPGIIYHSNEDNQNKIINFKIKIEDEEIPATLSEDDIKLANELIYTEYGILTTYAKSPYMQQAWERYYRLVFRDNYGRIEPILNDIIFALTKKGSTLKKDNLDLYIMQSVLTWVQNRQYKRAQTATESDFTSLLDLLNNVGCDCDSRSMLMCAFANKLGIDNVLLISPIFSHALSGIAINAPGQKISPSDKGGEYLMGETTAKVTWGTIIKEHSDKSKWFAIKLPY